MEFSPLVLSLFGLTLFSLLLFSACDDEALFSADGIYIRLKNETDTQLTDLNFSFGFEENTRFVSRLNPGRASGYYRFEFADRCSGIFLEGQLASGGTVNIGRTGCAVPDPIAPGRYSFVISEVAFSDPDSTRGTFIQTEVVED
ncbi:MAG: hypothetical protein ACI81P_000257 [Neolewinella sp.]|jgi:hypothetical protein